MNISMDRNNKEQRKARDKNQGGWFEIVEKAQNAKGWFEIVDEKQPVDNSRKQNVKSDQYGQDFADFFSPQNRVQPPVDNQNEHLFIDVDRPRERKRPTRNTRSDRLVIDDDDYFVQTDTPRRKRQLTLQRNVPWMVIFISLAAFSIIIFAFIVEARANRAEEAANRPPPVSEMQAMVESQDWIEQALIPVNEFSRPGTNLARVNGIVIHNIGNPGTTAMQNRNYFANLAISQERKASSNFIVDLNGDIIQCVPVDEVAFASNDRNDDTLSIEVCHPDDTGKFTDESYAATVRLTAWLCKQYGLTADDVIRHHDVRPNGCPRYFVDNEDAWEQFKADVARAIAG